MLSSVLLVALAALSSTFVSAAGNDTVCSTSLYASLGCLTKHAAVATLCAKLPEQTLTITSTTTTLAVNSVTVTRNAQSQVTVHSTSTQWSSKTVTSGPVKTITSTHTSWISKNATTATYVPTATQGSGLFPPFCRPPHAISALGSLHNGTLATACSCLGHPAKTTTTTTIITAKPVKVTSTAVQGTAPTTTIYQIVLSTTTLTVQPMKTVSTHVIKCTTATVVQTYAAPTFTKVYGPKAGCADIAPGRQVKLDDTIKRLPDAVEECRSQCEQDATCEFVYAQRMSSQSDGRPYWGCVLNEEHFDASKDLDCGRKAGVYGVALGFDARGRGTEPLV